MSKSVIVAVTVMEDAPNKEQIEKLLSDNTHVVKKDIPELDDHEIIDISNEVDIDIRPIIHSIEETILIDETQDLSE
jgi:hypothetical protein